MHIILLNILDGISDITSPHALYFFFFFLPFLGAGGGMVGGWEVNLGLHLTTALSVSTIS